MRNLKHLRIGKELLDGLSDCRSQFFGISYLLHVRMADHTGVAKFQAFNKEGVAMVGKTADELMALKVWFLHTPIS